MYRQTALEPVDYLVVGHLTLDLTPAGPRLGGTAAYAALTAASLGLRVGIVTSWGDEEDLGKLSGIPIINLSAEKSTTFDNIDTPEGRIQFIHHVAQNLDLNLIPEIWLNTPIVHLGPVAQEVEPSLVRHFTSSLIGISPQGWLRAWDREGRVTTTEWPEADFVLRRSGAAVLSTEDVDDDEVRIEEMASSCRVLAVTEGAGGARLFWNGDVRRFQPIEVLEIDSTGSGDIFAAAFFYRMYMTRDPWESARFANHLAGISVTRPGLEAIPTPEEIKDCMAEVL
jgi:sugar/nucleoside kinase (ribokinase family)